MNDPSSWQSDAAILDRARKYIAPMPVAVSGSNGHMATWKVACALMKGWALSLEQGLDLISEWNTTCQPPWTEAELIHKLEDAANATGRTGYLRDAKPEKWNSIRIPLHNPSQKNAKKKQAEREKTVHPTLEKVALAIAWKLCFDGKIDSKRKPDFGWKYQHEDGSDAFVVFRWNLPDGGKTFGQATRVANGWISGGMPAPRPLYRVCEIKNESKVIIVESEKVAKFVATYLGLPTVSPSQGALSPQLTNWGPLEGKELAVCGDNDDAGRKFITQVIALLRQQAPSASWEVKDLRKDWPEIHQSGDLYDWIIQFQELGKETLLERFYAIPDSSAEYDTPGLVSSDSTGINPVEIELQLDERSVNDLVIAALAERDDIYVHNGRLAVIGSDAMTTGTELKTVHYLMLPSVREIIAETCLFYTETETADGEVLRKYERPSKWIYEAVFVRGEWPGIKPLRAVVNSPVLRPDGTVVQTAGYDPESGMFIHLNDEFPEVPDFPTVEQIKAAADQLRDVVCDFPFKSEAHLAAWVAAVLTPVAREGYRGPTSPLFLIDANVRGSGKSLLGDLIALIVEMREALRFTAPQNDEESRKRITALVENCDRVILIDNIVGAFGCPSLDAALTGTVWKDRRLGHSTMVEAPLRMTWLGSGNNVILAADTTRRVCHVRLESNLENPEDRDEFKYPDIRKHVRKNRPMLLTAALTTLRGFIAAGRPDQRLKPWGSFEGWSDLVRQAVVFAGFEDPGKTREELRETSDSEAGSLSAMLEAVNSIDSAKHGFTAAQLIQIASGHDHSYSPFEASSLKEAVEQFCDGTIDRITSRRLGNRLKHFRNRVCGGMSFECTLRTGINCWFVQISGGSGVSSGSDLSHLKREETSCNQQANEEFQSSNAVWPRDENDPPNPPDPPDAESIEWAEAAFR